MNKNIKRLGVFALAGVFGLGVCVNNDISS